jgi:small subunit ribosomal protein S9
MEQVAKKQGGISVVGRRKEAVARVRVNDGNGTITVNGKPITEYFLGPIFQKLYTKPLELTKTVGKYAITVKVEGGGQVAQLGALVHGMARGLAKMEPSLRVTLKKEGLLTRDPRAKERKKYGNAQKARAKKQSPKR